VLDQLVEGQAELAEGLAHAVLDAEGEQVVRELRAGQVLGRQVHHRAVLPLEVRRGRAHPAIEQPIAHRVGEGEVAVVPRRDARELGEDEEELLEEIVTKRPGVVGERDLFGADGARCGRTRHGDSQATSSQRPRARGYSLEMS
jgi:hypothetical protein